MKSNGDKTKTKPVNTPEKIRARITEPETSAFDDGNISQRLKESEEKYRNLFELSPVGITILDMKGVIQSCNSAVYEMGDYSESELIGKHFSKIAPIRMNDIPKFIKIFNSVISGKPLTPFQVEYRRKNGATGWTEVQAAVFETNGKKAGVQVIQRDISIRKQAERALKESEEFRSKLLDILPNPIIVVNPDNSTKYVNPAFEKLTGFPAREIIGIKPPNLWWRKEATEEAMAVIEKNTRRTKKERELLFQKKNGKKFWVVSSSTPVIIDNNLQYTLITWNDITERKKTEEDIRLKAELLDNASDSINVIDLDGNFLYVNRVFCKSHGYNRKELMGMNIIQLVQQTHGISTHSMIKEIIGKGEIEFETTHLRKDGSPVKMEVHSLVMESGGNKFILNVERDITERLQKEEEIRKLSAAVEYSPNIIMIMDKDGIIEYVNKKYIELVGYEAGEVIGNNMRDIDLQPVKEQKKIWKNLAEGRDWHYEFINRKRNGELYYESSSVSAIRDTDGNITHFIKVATDVTDKKRTEGELQKSEEQLRELSNHMRQMREEERKKIARNIHDNLGQSLTALKMDIAWLTKRLSPEQLPLIEKAGEISVMIDETIMTVKNLTSELRPEILDILGLAAAIEWYTEEFSKRTGIKCILNQGEDDIKLEQEHLIDCYRIFQEALTNISLHASATRVRINLKQEPDKFTMQIRDNGKGIPGNRYFKARSFGLMGMQERANSIGGNLEIKSAPGKGTTVKLTVPMK